MLDLEPATRMLADLVGGVRDEQLTLPTPCAGAALGDLLDHVDRLSIALHRRREEDILAPRRSAPPP